MEDRTQPRARNFDVSPLGDRMAVLRQPPAASRQPITKILIVTNALADREPAGSAP